MMAEPMLRLRLWGLRRPGRHERAARRSTTTTPAATNMASAVLLAGDAVRGDQRREYDGDAKRERRVPLGGGDVPEIWCVALRPLRSSSAGR